MESLEKQRYVDIMSNSGFKAVFGDQENKPVLIDFLNAVLPRGRKVKDLTYTTTEIEGITSQNKSIKLDLRCEDEDGTSFIIEMQKYDQENFFKRCVSYSSKVYDIKNTKGDRDYDIPPVYLIGILAVDCF
ncbi:MAG: Rpn family recombination-promoting nuclease/putative transposase, partial [Bacteroidales bacterium]|nr:Rpn family recombination-promoting nuclease/putative transposase [Bacteroidales bacterium]